MNSPDDETLPLRPLDIVDELRDLNDAERNARLKALGLPPDVLAQVERCLSLLPRAVQFLEQPPPLVREAWATPHGGNSRALIGVVNESFGEYRLIEHLASGSFGEVWIAAHRSLDTPQAVPTCLKLLYPDRSDLDDVLREARTMASIRHENVVSVRRADRAMIGDREIAFIEMELVGEVGETGRFEPARSLAQAGIENGRPRFDCNTAMSIAAGICRGVHAAHVRGTLHRDLKPLNILLENRSLRAKVTDFGISSHSPGSGMATGQSKGLGTPAYMPPEQARGESTQASDIYALGAILYFLFSGRPPYSSPAGHSAGSGWQAILDQLSSGQPPDPLPAERKIPRAAAAIVAKAMSRDPELRYASAAAMAEDLDACRTNRPTVAARPTTAGRLGLWYRRNPLVATLVIILLIVAVVGPSAYVRALRREQKRTESHRQAAVAAQQLAVANEGIAIEQRRRAEQQVAEGLVLQADAYSLANRWLTARATYREAALALEKLGLSTFAADTGLWSAQRSSRPPLLEWQTPQWPSLAIAFSPDGHLLATGGGQKILRLWDPLTGRLLHERAGHEGAIMCVAFSPDGATLATGSGDGTVRLWKTEGNDPPRLIQPTNHKYVQAVAFSPDGTLLASGGYDNTLHLWDTHTGQSKADIPFKHAVKCIRFFPGGNRIAVVSDAIQIIDVQSTKVIRSLPSNGVVVAISADGSRLLAEAGGKGISIWNTATWQVVQTLAGHDGAQISAASFVASSSTRAVTAGWDKSVRVWDLTKPKEEQNIAPHEGWVLAAALSPDGRRLVTSGYDRIAPMKLWDLDANPPQLHGDARDLSPDGRCALVSGGDDKLHVIDLATGTDLRILPDSKNTSSLTVFRHGISQVYATSAQGIARQWEVSSGSVLTRPRDTGQWLARSPDGRYSLFDEKDGLVLHDDDANRPVWRKNFQQYVQSAAFSGDGRVIAAWSQDANPEILVIDAAGANKLNLFTSDTAYQTRDAALSRDGQLLLSTSGTDIIEVRNTRTGESVRTFSTHGTPIGHVAIAPDGTWIAGCGEDATIWLWDTASGREIRSFRVGAYPRALRIAADGKHLLVSGEVSIHCDFSLASQERALAPKMQAARATLDQHPGDPAALAAIGQWYAFRHSDDLAIELLERARAGGAKVSPLEMARVYRRLGRNSDAAREYRNAKLQNEAPADYLELCITASEGN